MSPQCIQMFINLFQLSLFEWSHEDGSDRSFDNYRCSIYRFFLHSRFPPREIFRRHIEFYFQFYFFFTPIQISVCGSMKLLCAPGAALRAGELKCLLIAKSSPQHSCSEFMSLAWSSAVTQRHFISIIFHEFPTRKPISPSTNSSTRGPARV